MADDSASSMGVSRPDTSSTSSSGSSGFGSQNVQGSTLNSASGNNGYDSGGGGSGGGSDSGAFSQNVQGSTLNTASGNNAYDGGGGGGGSDSGSGSSINTNFATSSGNSPYNNGGGSGSSFNGGGVTGIASAGSSFQGPGVTSLNAPATSAYASYNTAPADGGIASISNPGDAASSNQNTSSGFTDFGDNTGINSLTGPITPSNDGITRSIGGIGGYMTNGVRPSYPGTNIDTGLTVGANSLFADPTVDTVTTPDAFPQNPATLPGEGFYSNAPVLTSGFADPNANIVPGTVLGNNTGLSGVNYGTVGDQDMVASYEKYVVPAANALGTDNPERSYMEQASINMLKDQYTQYGGAYTTIAPPPALPAKQFYDRVPEEQTVTPDPSAVANGITSYGPFRDQYSFNPPDQLAAAVAGQGFNNPTPYGAATQVSQTMLSDRPTVTADNGMRNVFYSNGTMTGARDQYMQDLGLSDTAPTYSYPNNTEFDNADPDAPPTKQYVPPVVPGREDSNPNGNASDYAGRGNAVIVPTSAPPPEAPPVDDDTGGGNGGGGNDNGDGNDGLGWLRAYPYKKHFKTEVPTPNLGTVTAPVSTGVGSLMPNIYVMPVGI